MIGLLLAIVVGGAAFAAYRRGPRSASEPEAAWRGVVSLARRFGFAPKPNQTVFEYSAALGEVLPNARPDLQTVARAKVEVAYGRGRSATTGSTRSVTRSAGCGSPCSRSSSADASDASAAEGASAGSDDPGRL